MAKMVGYPTFLAEHILFGLALGLLMLTLSGRCTSGRPGTRLAPTRPRSSAF